MRLTGILAARALILPLAAASLLSGMAGGLARAGALPAALAGPDWIGPAVGGHAALMICGFLASVIGVERAVAVRHPAAWLAPLACTCGAVALLVGLAPQATGLFLAAAIAFVAVNVVVVRRQRAVHCLILLVAALCWLAGNVLLAAGAGMPAVLAWWFAFLVLTIAAERLEMTRLMRRRPWTLPSLALAIALLLAGALASIFPIRSAGVLFGLGLLALAAWFATFDIARRTVLAGGLSRYMAICLLCGYAWLALSGIAWAGMALGCPARDAAIHALGLGFIISMVMAHAPVILPAVARIKLHFGNYFYLPVALFHCSLILRICLGPFDPALRALGARLNAAAILAFVLTLAGAALAFRHGQAQQAARARLSA